MDKSPRASVIQGTSVAKKAIEKKRKVSIIEPKIDDVKGAINQLFFLS